MPDLTRAELVKEMDGWASRGGMMGDSCFRAARQIEEDGATIERLVARIERLVARCADRSDIVAQRDALCAQLAVAEAEAARLREALHKAHNDVHYVLSALRSLEEATGESFDDEGGIVAQIEAEYHPSQMADDRMDASRGATIFGWIVGKQGFERFIGIPEEARKHPDAKAVILLSDLRPSPSEPSPEARELAKQLRCQHSGTRGGNDYLECKECGFEWDYRKVSSDVIRERAASYIERTAPQGVTDGWRDISTAPRDGTIVWAWAEGRRWLAAFEVSSYGPSLWRMQGYVGDRVTLTSGDISPTHWQPLPAPPAAGGAK